MLKKNSIPLIVTFLLATAPLGTFADTTPNSNLPESFSLDLSGCDPALTMCHFATKNVIELVYYFQLCDTLKNITVSLKIANNQTANITADPNGFCKLTIDGLHPMDISKPVMSVTCPLTKDEVSRMISDGGEVLNQFFTKPSRDTSAQMKSNFNVIIDCIKDQLNLKNT